MEEEIQFYVWGAGYSTQVLLYAINKIAYVCDKKLIKVSGIIDSDKSRWGSKFLDYSVVSPEEAYTNNNRKIIIPLEKETTKEISENLVKKEYLYQRDFWDASNFLAEYLINCTEEKKLNEKENIYFCILNDLFSYRHTVKERYYMFVHIVNNYLKILIENKSDISKVILYAEKINWIKILQPELCDFFRKHKEVFFRSSYDLDAQILWNANVQMLSKSIFFSGNIIDKLRKIELFCLDSSHILIIDNNELYFVTNPLSVEYIMYFFDISKSENKGRFLFVANYLKKNIIQSMYLKLSNIEEIDDNEIAEIKKISKYSEKYEYLMAKKYFLKKDYEKALKYIDIGLEKRQFGEKLCLLKGDILTQKKNYKSAIKYYARTMLKNSTKEQLWMVLPNGNLNADLDVQKRIEFCIKKYSHNDSEKIQECMDILSRELIVVRSKFKEKKLVYRNGLFMAIDNLNLEREINYESKIRRSIKGITRNKLSEYFEGLYYKDYRFEVNSHKIYILPIQRVSNANIKIEYKSKTLSYQGCLNEKIEVGRIIPRFPKNQWVSIRISDSIHIISDEVFLVGNPIEIKKADVYPPIIINLFIDALAFSRVKEVMDEYMPYTKSFFEKGIIFNECYAVGEWTQTCYPSMFLGVNPNELECFQPRFQYAAPPWIKSIPEQLQKLGYYNTLITADPSERFFIMGPERGFEHSLEMVNMKIEVSIDEVIDMLRIYNCPVFFNVHTLEIHNSHFQMGKEATLELQTGSIDYETVMESDSYYGSENISIEDACKNREKIYLKLLQQLDFKLRVLYEYLEKNYSENDMLVCLHSDHGAFGGFFPLSSEHSNIAMMFRGKGVEQKGIINEIISAMDLYSIYGKLCGFKENCDKEDSILPRVFDGKGRDYATTYWRYPGQCYRVAINTCKYEFLFESMDEVTTDGRIWAGEYRFMLLDKQSRKEIYDDKIADYFISIIEKDLRLIYEGNI